MTPPKLRKVILVVTDGGTPIAIAHSRDQADILAARCGDWVCESYVDEATWLKMGMENGKKVRKKG